MRLMVESRKQQEEANSKDENKDSLTRLIENTLANDKISSREQVILVLVGSLLQAFSELPNVEEVSAFKNSQGQIICVIETKRGNSISFSLF